MKRLYAFVIAAALCFPSIGAMAWWQSIQQVAISSGAAPTWTGTGAFANASCGFVTTCTLSTTATVTTGIVVAVAGIANAGAAGTITAVSVCGTPLTIDASVPASVVSNGTVIAHGSVTGGTCTITVTFSTAGAVQKAGIAFGTLNNLSSSTPGTACSANYPGSQPSPYPCTGGLVVSAGGFGIVGYFDNQTTTPTNGGGSLTVDATAGGTAIEVAIGHVTANCTAAQCQYAAAGFALANIIGEPFR